MLAIKLFFLLLVTLKSVCGYSADDLHSVFSSKACVEGSILSMQTGAVLTTSMSKDIETITKRLSLLNTILASPDTKVTEKSILGTVNELAQYNKIDYHYELIREEGPPHSKIFTVALNLGEEVHQAEGNSLKVAQRNAGKVALEATNYKQHPLTVKSDEDKLLNTPTVQLNNIRAQLALKVEYELMDKSALEDEDSHSNVTEYNEKPKSSYLVRLNHSIYHPDAKDRLRVKSGESESTGQPFVVKVTVGDRNYLGVGLTVQAARHDAALVALEDMKRQAIEEENDCTIEGNEESCRLMKESLKSPITLVYEAAQKRNLDVNFEIISETGPSHKKVFVTECTLGDFKIEAEGKSKKESKRLAAEKMLEKVQELPEVTNKQDYSIILRKKQKNQKAKKNKRLVKNKLDKLKLSASNALSSVWSYMSDATSPEDGNKMDYPKNQPDSTNKRKNALETNGDSISMKDELLHLTQSIGIQVQFTDLNKMGDNYFTLLSLSMKRPYLCLGEGPTTQKAQEKASLEAINLVHKLGLTKSLKDYVYGSDDLVKEDEDEVLLKLLSKEESDK